MNADVNCEKSLWNDCLHILFLSKCSNERKRKADRNTRDKMQSDLSHMWQTKKTKKKKKTNQLQTVCKTLEHILCLIFLCHLHRCLEPLSWALDCGFCLITRASLLFYVSTSSLQLMQILSPETHSLKVTRVCSHLTKNVTHIFSKVGMTGSWLLGHLKRFYLRVENGSCTPLSTLWTCPFS